MNKNKSEIHIFIIWEKARHAESEILDDINQKFTVLSVYKSAWSRRYFSENLSRFYGEKLPDCSFKERHCGQGEFLLIIVEDQNPEYDYRGTSAGKSFVNINMFDAKELYRSWTGGGHKIHATNDNAEVKHDLSLLLGLEAAPYLTGQFCKTKNSSIKSLYNLVGAETWNSITELFYVLNNTCNYVVLRNFDCLPDNFTLKGHDDIDLLVDNYQAVSYITNARRIYKYKSRVLNQINIQHKDVLFDFRYLGDNYYDQKWQKNILKKRQLSSKGFYRPDPENYFFSLLYHALIHKTKISLDYKKKLIIESKKIDSVNLSDNSFNNQKEAEDILVKFLNERDYLFTLPLDLSVRFNRQNKYLVKAIRIYNFIIFSVTLFPVSAFTPKKIYKSVKESILINKARIGS